MKTVAEVIGVSRSNLADRLQERCKKRIGRPPLPDDELVSKIKAVIAELATYGYRRVHAVLKRQALAAGLKPPNHKRVYRVMKVHGLLLDRHVGGDERRHDGRIAVDERNRRWCSDGFEIGCDNGERVRVAFALDCCDREAMSFLATTGGIAGEDVRDLMVAAVEYRFGQVNRLPVTIEWLSDNGSCYVAGDTRSFAREIGSNRGQRLSKVHRATEWLKLSFARSSATMSASVRDQMPKPSCVSCQLGSPTTTRFTRTRLSDIIHRVSSSQLMQDADRVRSFGGYNTQPQPSRTNTGGHGAAQPGHRCVPSLRYQRQYANWKCPFGGDRYNADLGWHCSRFLLTARAGDGRFRRRRRR